MTALMLDRGLATSESNSPVWHIARSSTLAAVVQLNGQRKAILLKFLFESNLIGAINPIIKLSGADLTTADLSGANLRGADLFRANLSGADLGNVILNTADLYGANLSGANLYGANLIQADLSDADLSDAFLRFANLSDADLRGANLRGAYLIQANLSGARGWTNKQLAQALSLLGATLPDGTVMTEEAWEEFMKRHR
jgi:uncharacterized protein YjbI with pentapeptide repeats